MCDITHIHLCFFSFPVRQKRYSSSRCDTWYLRTLFPVFIGRFYPHHKAKETLLALCQLPGEIAPLCDMTIMPSLYLSIFLTNKQIVEDATISNAFACRLNAITMSTPNQVGGLSRTDIG